MNMNMKNEKTMLALVLVAALAMVSVAGVALASESDAADGEVTYLNGSATVTSTTGDIFVYGGSASAPSTVTIPATVTYSGTISFGYYNPNSGANVAFGTITLNGASGVTVTYDGKTMSVSGTYTGDITLTKGSVSIDSTYSGSIVAGNATFANDKAYGYTVSLRNGNAFIGGIIEAGEVTVTGSADIDFESSTVGLTVKNGATLTIAEGATVNTTPYSVTTYDFSFKVNETETSTGFKLYTDAARTAQITNVIDSTGTTGKNVSIKGISAGIYYYTMTNGSAATYVTGALIVNDGMFYVLPDYAVSTTSGTATYVADSTYKYTVVIDTNIKDTNNTTTTNVEVTYTTGASKFAYVSTYLNGVITITFTTTAANLASAIDEIGTLDIAIKGGITGTTLYTYSGTIEIKIPKLTDSKATDGKFTLSALQSVDSQAKSIKGVADFSSSDIVKTTIDGTLNVNGTLNVTNSYVKATSTVPTAYYKSTSLAIGNSTDAAIFANGLITYAVEQSSGSSATPIDDSRMNASMYSVISTATTTLTFDVYYYTTLKDALAASAEVTIYGKQVISEDMTLATSVAGADETIIAAENGYLEIGIKADSTATPVVVGVTAIVTVPETTTLDLKGTAASEFGWAYVMNGQLKFEGLEYDSYDNVYAEVFMTDATYGIYTDVITALKQAVSGDEIEVRNIVTVITISENIEVIKGVTLNAAGQWIFVDNDVTFTVSGVLEAQGVSIAIATSKLTAGTMVINSNDITLSNSTYGIVQGTVLPSGIYVRGILTIASTFDNVTDDDKFSADIFFAGSKTYSATINVNGKINYAGEMNGVASASYVTINVVGTLNVLEDVGTTGYAVMNVTGSLYTEAIVEVCELYVTGTGSVTVEELSDSNYVYVAKKLVSGTASTDVGKTTNNTVITAIIEDNIAATVYGEYTAKNIVIYTKTIALSTDPETAESTAYYVADKYNDFYLYMTLFGVEVTALDLTAPEFTSYTFIGWYDAAVSGSKLPVSGTAATIENYPAVYGYTEVKTATVTLYPETNGHWVVNGNSVTSGNVQLELDGNTISFEADSGYKFDGAVTILVNGDTMPSNYQPVSGDVITVSATIVKDEKEAGMDLVTILLIIITIVIIIMAIIIALKLMRS